MSKTYLSYLVLIVSIFISCGGSSDNDEDFSLPSNLVVEALIVGADAANPNGDGSGSITLNFSATNANLYKVNFGDGETIETSNNSVTHTYIGGGINSFTIYVSAYKADKFITQSTTISIKVNSSLLWADEFDGIGTVNSENWTYEIGTGQNGWGNGEAQYYTGRLENAKVENGILTITAKKESYEGSNYTSARLITLNKFDFKYGKVEVKAKLPQGGGTWPAIWMLGSNIKTVGWPDCGEVDIMEHVGNNQGTVQSAMHTPSSYGNTQNHGSQFLDDVSTAFHVYSVEWTSEKMIFSVDEKVHYTYNPSVKNSSTWPFDAKQFIILNIAMGGGFGGNIDSGFTFSTMEIDYVRVYQ